MQNAQGHEMAAGGEGVALDLIEGTGDGGVAVEMPPPNPEFPTIGWEVPESLINAIRDMTPMQLKPVNKRVWLQQIPSPEMTDGGLHLPQKTTEESRNYGIVRAVADDVKVCKVGQVVRVVHYTGEEVCYRGSTSEAYFLVEEDSITAILDVACSKA